MSGHPADNTGTSSGLIHQSYLPMTAQQAVRLFESFTLRTCGVDPNDGGVWWRFDGGLFLTLPTAMDVARPFLLAVEPGDG